MKQEMKEILKTTIKKFEILLKNLEEKKESEEEIRNKFIENIVMIDHLFKVNKKINNDFFKEGSEVRMKVKESANMLLNFKQINKDYKKHLFNELNEAFKSYGITKTLRTTNIAQETYMKIKNRSENIRIETLQSAIKKINKNKEKLELK